MNDTTAKDRVPPDPPQWFWDLMGQAKLGPEAFRAALSRLSQQEVALAYAYLADLARVFNGQRYVSHMDPDTSEDGAFDVGLHIVAQGREHFRDIYQHPEKVPREQDPGTKEERMLPGDIIEFYVDEFGEDLPDIEVEYP